MKPSSEGLRRAGRGLALGLGAVGLTVLLVGLIVSLLGGNPGRALSSIFAGSLGSASSLAEVCLKATPLLFTGLAIAVAFRAGGWTIGAEGQFLVGMLGATAAALYLPPMPAFPRTVLTLLSGSCVGAVWAALPAWMRLKRDVPEVISTIMLNFLAVYLVEYLVRGPMKDPTSASDWSPRLPDAACLPRFSQIAPVGRIGVDSIPLAGGLNVAGGLELGRLHLGVLVALLTLAGVWIWLDRTRLGFQLRAVGLGTPAARSAGIPTGRVLWIAFVISGALAGLGGGVEVSGMIQRMYRYAPGSPGYGFSGIAVALLGGLAPGGVVLSAVFFGALSAGCSQMQRSAGVSIHVASIVQAATVILLVLLPGLRKRFETNRPPES